MRMLCLALMLGLAACTTPSGTTTFKTPLSRPIDTHSTVSVQLRAGEDPDAAAVTRDLRREIFAGLVSDGLFRQVVQPDEPADYRLVIALKDVRVVSNAARVMGAAFAGPDRITADVELRRGAEPAPMLAASITADSAVTMTGRNDIQAATDGAVLNREASFARISMGRSGSSSLAIKR